MYLQEKVLPSYAWSAIKLRNNLNFRPSRSKHPQRKNRSRSRSARSKSVRSRSGNRSRSRSRSRSKSRFRSRNCSRTRSTSRPRDINFKEPGFLDAFRVLYLARKSSILTIVSLMFASLLLILILESWTLLYIFPLCSMSYRRLIFLSHLDLLIRSLSIFEICRNRYPNSMFRYTTFLPSILTNLYIY